MNHELLHVSSEEFSTQISTNWRGLREESDFFDVTLACQGSMAKAHKVILSASSPVLKQLIIQTQHPHPVIYLTGVKQLQVKLVLDFIYKGEVNVAKDQLDNFLDVAKELKIIGLTVNEDEKQIKQVAENKNKYLDYDKANDDLSINISNEVNESNEVRVKEEPYECENEHANKPYIEYKICQFCHKKVSKKGNDFKNHLEHVHGHVKEEKQKTLCCPYCFETKEDYRALTVCRHKHKNDKSWTYPPEFKCEDTKCAGVSYSGTLIERKTFMQHKRNHHNIEFIVKSTSLTQEALTCLFCKKTFANGFSLKKHEDVTCRYNPAYNRENYADEREKSPVHFQTKADNSYFKNENI